MVIVLLLSVQICHHLFHDCNLFCGGLVYSMQNYQDTSILKSKYLTTPIK